MRLWSLHPRYLDRQGLTACWREALLAQAVLAGRTRGYRHHPQLVRFREQRDPLAVIGGYLAGVHAEATSRGYVFDAGKVCRPPTGPSPCLPVADGQVAYEWARLLTKLRQRSPQQAAVLADVREPQAHPLFRMVSGPVAEWEVVNRGGR